LASTLNDMEETTVHEGGMLCATGLTLVATLGHFLTVDLTGQPYEGVWLAVFVVALLTLAGSVVNFDPKRWLK